MAPVSLAVQILSGTPDGALTPQQSRFNALSSEVVSWRDAVAQWEERLARCDRTVGPVQREVHAAWRQWAFALDTASLRPGLTRGERAQLDELVRETATVLLSEDDADAEIAALLQRHAVEPDRDEPVATPIGDEEPFGQVAQDWEQRAAAAAAWREQRAAHRRAASQQRLRAQAAQEVSQSLRDVYRRLASALHPDREPDAQQRARKTGLMQQANDAYAQGNLLALLELQLAAEQIDAAHLAAIDQKRLEHYIAVLEEQLADLRAEARRLETEFRAAVGLGPGTGLQARKLDRQITAEAQRLRADLALLRADLRVFADVQGVRDWLRERRKG